MITQIQDVSNLVYRFSVLKNLYKVINDDFITPIFQQQRSIFVLMLLSKYDMSKCTDEIFFDIKQKLKANGSSSHVLDVLHFEKTIKCWRKIDEQKKNVVGFLYMSIQSADQVGKNNLKKSIDHTHGSLYQFPSSSSDELDTIILVLVSFQIDDTYSMKVNCRMFDYPDERKVSNFFVILFREMTNFSL
ncbi:hypothetical protein BDA99DRAFT_538174 [Phascolomyces articulosus]|uniref:Uncharacterized protein n=1 Tax=Phascolomyces articulosus TaxID=60185 RepID=A0AAD5JYA2_9FUNG|nr:hypothetical protein BDA99DRAFT_538174 [Phascolomyces articulosus]